MEYQSKEGSEPILESTRRLTICVVGSGGVGKSSLVTRYLHGHFPEVYDPTVGKLMPFSDIDSIYQS